MREETLAYDYDALYRQKRHALGSPSKDVTEFFKSWQQPPGHVLDLGCGQGRDALFMARMGHRVTAVDLSSAGIAQLREDSIKESLRIKCIVADLRGFAPHENYDVILMDRTLHMLNEDHRRELFSTMLHHVNGDGFG